MIKDEVKEMVKFGKVINIIDGLTYSPDNTTDDVTALKVLRSSNVQNGALDLEDLVYVDGISINYDKYIQVNDILICVRNGSKNLIGKNCLIQSDIYPATHGAFMSVIRTSNPKYIYSLLNSQQAKREISRNLSATINQITKNDLNNYKFKLHSENLQTEIGSYLSSIDNLISLSNKKINKLLMTKTMYSNMIFSIKTMRNWNLEKLEALYEISNTGVDKKINSTHTKVNLLNYMDVYKKTIYTNHSVTATNKEITNCIVQKDDLFITPSSETAQDIMNAFAIKENLDNYVYSYHICRLRGSSIHSTFAEYYFNSHFVRNQFSKLATGATRFTISKTELMKYFMYFPSEETQKNIATTLSQMDNYIKSVSFCFFENQHILNFFLLTLNFLKFIIKIAST